MKSNILAEKGEIFKSNNGGISKVSSKAPSHDDNIVALPNGNKKVVKSTGGIILPNADSVLSDSYTQVKNGVRKNSEMEQIVKIGKKEGNSLLEELGFSPTLKSAVSPSKLFEKALEEREGQVKKLAKSENKLDASKFSFNSKQANQSLASAIPNEDDIYETIFAHQEAKKEISDVDFDAEALAQYGGKPLVVNNPNDPRLRGYKDSLTLYNNYKELEKALLKQKYIKKETTGDIYENIELFKNYKNKDNSKRLNIKKESPTLNSVNDFVPGIINNTLPRQLYSNTIKPKSADSYWFRTDFTDKLKMMFKGEPVDPRERDERLVANYENVKPKQKVVFEPHKQIASEPLTTKKIIVRKKTIQPEVYPTIPTNTSLFEETPINFDSLELPQEEIYTPPKPREYTSGQQSYELNTDYLKRLHEESVRGKKQPPKLIKNQFGGSTYVERPISPFQIQQNQEDILKEEYANRQTQLKPTKSVSPTVQKYYENEQARKEANEKINKRQEQTNMLGLGLSPVPVVGEVYNTANAIANGLVDVAQGEYADVAMSAIPTAYSNFKPFLNKTGIKLGLNELESHLAEIPEKTRRFQQMRDYGISFNQRKAYNPIVSDLLSKYIIPFGYPDKYSNYLDILKSNIKNKGWKDNENLEEILPNWVNKTEKNAREDSWNLYLGIPQKNNTYSYIGKDNDKDMFIYDNYNLEHKLDPKRITEKGEIMYQSKTPMGGFSSKQQLFPDIYTNYDETNKIVNIKTGEKTPKEVYTDVWDLNFKNQNLDDYVGKPFTTVGVLNNPIENEYYHSYYKPSVQKQLKNDLEKYRSDKQQFGGINKENNPLSKYL